MFHQSVSFYNPWFLLLLGLVPLVAAWSYDSLAGLGKWRRWIAILLRSSVMVLLIFALADLQLLRSNDRITVIYLLDQSLSVPETRRTAMIRYVNASIRKHRREDKEDRAGVIVFGRDAEVEIPPVDFDVQLAPRVESLLDPNYTNLAGAMQQAMAMFPHDTAKRIVIVTDGNENLGNALEQARTMADSGVSIDAMPVPLEQQNEVSVEKITIPTDVRRDQPFELRVILNNDSPTNENVAGRLKITRKAGNQEVIITDAPVNLKPGKRVLTRREKINEPDFYTYQALFVPDDPTSDRMKQNNLATHFTDVYGQGQVLLIEDWENPGRFNFLLERLRAEGLAVTMQQSNRLFSSLPELQRYDSIILADVPRSSGFDANNVSSFTNQQIRMLVRNTEELGCGLIMLGGPNSFGVGGWANTEIEKAMPVNFTIKSSKVSPVGALVLNMHAGEIPKANYWQKVIAREAIKALGPRDYCGLLQWNGSEQWLWGQSKGGLIRVGPSRKLMMARIDAMNIGDMPQFDGSMKMAAAAFAGVQDASIRHMIIISDGDPTPPTPGTLTALKKQRVKVTTVLVGTRQHAPGGHANMQKIASTTGGKMYVVTSAKALPQIYQREARKIARSLVYEPNPPVQPQIKNRQEIIEGIEGPFPPIQGFVLTTIKESPLVDLILLSPKPVSAKNATILATWPYGLGKTVVFTTDTGGRWADQWTGWKDYDRFFSQMVRWSMRPGGDTGKFTVSTNVADGKTRVIVTALDKDNEFLNYQTVSGNVLGPDMESIPLDITQTAPGRYEAEFDSTTPGNYLVLVNPGNGHTMIRTGVNVGYSDEFRRRETNLALLESLANLPAKNGQPGELLDPLPAVVNPTSIDDLQSQLASDPFRRDLSNTVASRNIWPLLLLLASCVFLADVFVRRVHVSFAWMAPWWTILLGRLLGRDPELPPKETMNRLQSRKAELSQRLENRRSHTRFESTTEGNPQVADAAAPETTPRPEAPQTKNGKKSLAEQEATDEDSYTSRLLKAKKQVWKDRES
ncbi:MAG: VWA domain-containing protein [Pirellulales bacterium]|nr:VWA domain-containing protein [Pirellulales bacterium]